MMINKLIVFIAIFLASKGMFAQFPKLAPAVQPEMAWNGDGVVVSDAKAFVILKPGIKEPVTIPLPPNTVDNRFAQDCFWVVQEDISLQRFRICRSEDARKWEFVASFPFSDDSDTNLQKRRFYFHPLGEDVFLLVARAGTWFTVQGKPSAVVVAKSNDKKVLEISRSVDFGFREKIAWNKDDKIVINDHYIWFFSGTINRPFLTVGDRVFLAFRRIGTFIEIRPNGSIGRRFEIIPGLNEKTAINPDGYDWATLCAQPTKEGEILVLARTPEGVMDGRKYYPRTYTTASMNDVAKSEDTSRSDAAALNANPLMNWHKLDPITGKVYQVASPVNVPTMFDSIENFRKFVFHFEPTGNLIFPLFKAS